MELLENSIWNILQPSKTGNHMESQHVKLVWSLFLPLFSPALAARQASRVCRIRDSNIIDVLHCCCSNLHLEFWPLLWMQAPARKTSAWAPTTSLEFWATFRQLFMEPSQTDSVNNSQPHEHVALVPQIENSQMLCLHLLCLFASQGCLLPETRADRPGSFWLLRLRWPLGFL